VALKRPAALTEVDTRVPEGTWVISTCTPLTAPPSARVTAPLTVPKVCWARAAPPEKLAASTSAVVVCNGCLARRRTALARMVDLNMSAPVDGSFQSGREMPSTNDSHVTKIRSFSNWLIFDRRVASMLNSRLSGSSPIKKVGSTAGMLPQRQILAPNRAL